MHLSLIKLRSTDQVAIKYIVSSLFVAVLLSGYMAFYGISQTVGLDSAKIRLSHGHSYVYDLTYYANWADTPEAPQVSPFMMTENGVMFGKAHAGHQLIAERGRGAFSHWSTVVYFSTPDNTDPRINGRTYAAVWPITISVFWFLASLVLFSIYAIKWFNLYSGRSLVSYLVAFLRFDLVQTVLITVATFAVLVFLIESWFQITTPIVEAKWPSKFYSGVGWTFKPNAVVRHTNHLDFWNETKTNSTGFLDRENKVPTSDQCGITFIGDSFVEAAQVPIASKVQVVLEKLANTAHPDWNVVTSAFGYSGTGQLNQLPFYDRYAHKLKPKLIVLVFVSNDLGNNSAALEGVRYGWHPDHAPRRFAKRIGNSFKLLDTDKDWQKYLISPQSAKPVAKPWDIHLWLRAHSLAYSWVWRKMSMRFASLNRFESPDYAKIYQTRATFMKQDPALKGLMKGWNEAYSKNFEGLFLPKTSSAILDEAYAATKFSLQEFKRRAKRDGAQLVVLVTSQFEEQKDNATGVNNGFSQLKRMLVELKIPMLSQLIYLKQKKIDPATVGWRHDTHWTPLGHSSAAQLVLNFLQNNSKICSARLAR